MLQTSGNIVDRVSHMMDQGMYAADSVNAGKMIRDSLLDHEGFYVRPPVVALGLSAFWHYDMVNTRIQEVTNISVNHVRSLCRLDLAEGSSEQFESLCSDLERTEPQIRLLVAFYVKAGILHNLIMPRATFRLESFIQRTAVIMDMGLHILPISSQHEVNKVHAYLRVCLDANQ